MEHTPKCSTGCQIFFFWRISGHFLGASVFFTHQSDPENLFQHKKGKGWKISCESRKIDFPLMAKLHQIKMK